LNTHRIFSANTTKKISVIPILIEKCNIPSDFLEYEILNLTTDFDKGIDKLHKESKQFQKFL
jgi:hypothetical protein